MGSGSTRAFWRAQGSRTARRQNTKTRRAAGVAARLRIKRLRAEARRIATGETR